MAEFYRTNNRYSAEKSISSALERGQITQGDAELITKYTTERKARAGISPVRAKKVTSTLVSWRRFLTVPYKNLTINDLDTAILALKNGTTTKRGKVTDKPYSQNAQHDYIRILRQFVLWMVAEKVVKVPRRKVEEIKIPPVDTDTNRPEDLLTRAEILALIDAAQHVRDKALISTFYESGCRVGELARLQWRDLKFEDQWVEVTVTDEKSKKERYSCLVMSKEYLARWKDATKYRDPEDRVFVSLQDGKPIEYVTVRRILDRLQVKAEVRTVNENGKITIKQHLNPHLFRKSRITHLVNENYQESIIKKTMWNNLNTKMFSTYVKLGKDDINAEMQAKAGVKRKKVVEENPLAPRPCGRCHFVNPPTARFCNSCGFELSETVARSKDESRRKIEESPEFKAAVEQATKAAVEEIMKRQ
jgi:integrase/recombinase XerD